MPPPPTSLQPMSLITDSGMHSPIHRNIRSKEVQPTTHSLHISEPMCETSTHPLKFSSPFSVEVSDWLFSHEYLQGVGGARALAKEKSAPKWADPVIEWCGKIWYTRLHTSQNTNYADGKSNYQHHNLCVCVLGWGRGEAEEMAWGEETAWGGEWHGGYAFVQKRTCQGLSTAMQAIDQDGGWVNACLLAYVPLMRL